MTRFPHLSFKAIDNTLHHDDGCSTALDYVEQSSWVLFLKFQTADNRHEMTQIYEDRLRQMGNAGRNGGEYYTPRPLIRTIVKSVNPQVGETVYDGACGSAGFLCEAYTYMHSKLGVTSSEEEILQTKTFYGKELKGLAYIIAMMNMILHGVQSPNIVRTNTLSENRT